MSDEQFFGLICFMVLMQHDQGIFEKHPDYLKEKIQFLTDGWGVYNKLDRSDQMHVITYYLRWKMEIPAYVIEYEKEYANTLKNLQ